MNVVSTTQLDTREDRVIFLISKLAKTPNAFAVKIGKSAAAVYKILEKVNQPSLEFIDAIVSSYPDVNITWVITGEGEWNKKVPAQKLEEIDPNLLKDSKEKDDLIEELKKQVEFLRSQNEKLLAKCSVNDVNHYEAEVRELYPSLTSSLTNNAMFA